jgi:hypothetical protein
MAKHTHLVVVYNHDTKTFTFDGDGSREWIRRLYTPETNTWSDEDEEFVAVPVEDEDEAVNALEALGVAVEENGWQDR